jgi:dTDP-4-dehydrorhamnose reductase
MRIVVIGKNGQLSRCIQEVSKNKNLDIHFYSSQELNICSSEKIKFLLKEINPDILINTAAFTNVDEAEFNKEEAFKINYFGPLELSKICRDMNVILIHISTDYVFDGGKKLPYKPNDKTNPLSVYAKSKLAGEKAIVDSNCKYLILRTSWLFSKHGNNFLKKIISKALKEETLNVVNYEYSNPTYGYDLGEAIIEVAFKLKDDKFLRKIIHFTGSETLSRFEFASRILKSAKELNMIGKTVSINPIGVDQVEPDAIRPLNSSMDTTLFNDLFKFTPIDLEDAIYLTLRSLESGDNL